MTPIWGRDQQVAQWVLERAPEGSSPGFGPFTALGLVDEKTAKPVAGIVFHNWNKSAGTMEISVAADDARWASRSTMKMIADFAYVQHDCQMLVFRTGEDNGRIRRLLSAVGASEYLIPRMRGRAASEAIITLTKEQWEQSRFSEVPHGLSDT